MLRPSLPVCAFIAAGLVLTSIPPYWRERNVPALSLVAWFFALNVIYGVNSIIWAGSVQLHVPVWCDITTKLQIGASSAIFIATACMCKQFAVVASGRIMRQTNDAHRRRRHSELMMCTVVPVAVMLLHFIVQPHRFDIVEGLGCQPAVLASVPAILIVYLPPLLLASITVLYSVVGLYHFFTKRLTFTSHLIRSSPTDKSLYLRLMAMSLSETLWGVPFIALAIHYRFRSGLRPWNNWSAAHTKFSHVETYQLSQLPRSDVNILLALWWTIPISTFIFILFSAISEDAIKTYGSTYDWIRRVIFRRPSKLDNSLMDSFAVGKGAPKRIIVHKLSTVDIRSDVDDDDQTLPCYSPAANSLMAYTPNFKSKITFQTESRNSVVSISPFSVHSIPRILISEEFPASRPPTPPLCQDTPTTATPGTGSYSRPFSPPTVFRIGDNASRSSGIPVTVQHSADLDMV